MRLNFSGSREEDIREGVRRIGEVIAEQVELYGTLTGQRPAEMPAARRGGRADIADDELADILHLPRARAAAARSAVSRVAVLKGGRSLERHVSLRSGAQVEDALERLGHDVTGIDVGHDLVARLRELAPDAAFVALHGRDGEDGTVQELLEILGIPLHRLRRRRVHALRRQGRRQARASATRASRRRTSSRSARRRSRSSAPPTRSQAIEERLGFPLVVKPADQGSALGIKFARDRRPTSRPRSSPRSPTPTASCSSATSPAATSRSRSSTARRCRSSRRSRRARTSTTSRPATRSGAPRSSARPSSATTSRPPPRSSPCAPTRRSAAARSRAST